MNKETTWTEHEERGHFWLFKFLLNLQHYSILNWWTARLILYPVITFYFFLERDLRRVSREYLNRLYSHRGETTELDHKPTSWDCYLHFLEFGKSIFDRFALWMGYREFYNISSHGKDVFYPLLDSDCGAILLSFHVGNFYLMRYMAIKRDITINIIAYWENAPMVKELLEEVDPESNLNIIEIDPDKPESMIQLKNCIDRGEYVAVLGDRTSVGADSRTTEVDFLGAPASFPNGPFILASILECPVLITYTIRIESTTYEIHAEKFAEKIKLSRTNREEDLKKFVQKYARKMEEICCRVPYQWFNFFDFWNGEQQR